MTDYVLQKNLPYRLGRAHKLIERGTVLVGGKDDALIAFAHQNGVPLEEVKADEPERKPKK